MSLFCPCCTGYTVCQASWILMFLYEALPITLIVTTTILSLWSCLWSSQQDQFTTFTWACRRLRYNKRCCAWCRVLTLRRYTVGLCIVMAGPLTSDSNARRASGWLHSGLFVSKFLTTKVSFFFASNFKTQPIVKVRFDSTAWFGVNFVRCILGFELTTFPRPVALLKWWNDMITMLLTSRMHLFQCFPENDLWKPMFSLSLDFSLKTTTFVVRGMIVLFLDQHH